jgi:hypothetical protein
MQLENEAAYWPLRGVYGVYGLRPVYCRWRGVYGVYGLRPVYNGLCRFMGCAPFIAAGATFMGFMGFARFMGFMGFARFIGFMARKFCQL